MGRHGLRGTNVHTPDRSESARIIGQIARGEVATDPDAARRIAARHERAYGAAVWPTDPDTAWADACAGLAEEVTGR